MKKLLLLVIVLTISLSFTGCFSTNTQVGVTGGGLTGRIVDSETGSGISNAKIIINDKEYTSDSKGNFEISDLSGAVEYIIKKDNYRTKSGAFVADGSLTKIKMDNYVKKVKSTIEFFLSNVTESASVNKANNIKTMSFQTPSDVDDIVHPDYRYIDDTNPDVPEEGWTWQEISTHINSIDAMFDINEDLIVQEYVDYIESSNKEEITTVKTKVSTAFPNESSPTGWRKHIMDSEWKLVWSEKASRWLIKEQHFIKILEGYDIEDPSK